MLLRDTKPMSPYGERLRDEVYPGAMKIFEPFKAGQMPDTIDTYHQALGLYVEAHELAVASTYILGERPLLRAERKNLHALGKSMLYGAYYDSYVIPSVQGGEDDRNALHLVLDEVNNAEPDSGLESSLGTSWRESFTGTAIRRLPIGELMGPTAKQAKATRAIHSRYRVKNPEGVRKIPDPNRPTGYNMIFAEAELLLAGVASPEGTQLSPLELGHVARFRNINIPTGSTRYLEYYDGTTVFDAQQISLGSGSAKGRRSIMERIDAASDKLVYWTARAYSSERKARRAERRSVKK